MYCLVIFVITGGIVAVSGFLVERRRRNGIGGLYDEMAQQQQMQRGESLRANRRNDVLTFATYGALWCGIAAMTFGGIFVVWRETLLVLLSTQLQTSAWWDFSYIVTHVLLGLISVVVIIVANYMLRRSIGQKHVLMTFGGFALVLVGTGAVGVLVRNYLLAA